MQTEYMLEMSFVITQSNTTSPLTIASKMSTKLNQQLSETVQKKTEQTEIHKGRIYCMAIIWDCIRLYRCNKPVTQCKTSLKA